MTAVSLQQDMAPDRSFSVYGYTDYRLYLQDFYNFRKDSHRGYSYRAFSKAAGFTSPNILKLVIEGKRNISPEATRKFIKALGLSGQMAEYFSTLVRMNQAKSDVDKEYFFAMLKKLLPASKKRDLNDDSLTYMSHWLFSVIREMVALQEFRDDPYWIARRLQGKASLQEITKSLQWLKSHGFLTQDESGKTIATDNMVMSSDEIQSLAIRKYHKLMLSLSKEALDNLPLEEREFGALTFVLPEEALEELKYKIKHFRRELHTWAMQVSADKGGDIVVQTNMQMFPHTKKVTS